MPTAHSLLRLVIDTSSYLQIVEKVKCRTDMTFAGAVRNIKCTLAQIVVEIMNRIFLRFI